VFGQKPSKLTVKILRSILISYRKKPKAREIRRDLLDRVIRLENKISNQDSQTISQLLVDNVEVTRAAITAGPEYDESSAENKEDDGEK
jgi:hypothetical protein